MSAPQHITSPQHLATLLLTLLSNYAITSNTSVRLHTDTNLYSKEDTHTHTHAFFYCLTLDSCSAVELEATALQVWCSSLLWLHAEGSRCSVLTSHVFALCRPAVSEDAFFVFLSSWTIEIRVHISAPLKLQTTPSFPLSETEVSWL